MIAGAARRFVASLAVGLAGLLLAAAPASAHSETLRSDPPDGGMVPEGRTSLTLWFDEPIGVPASAFQLRTLGGLEVESSVDFENGADKIVVRTEPLARGQYVLDWHALSLADGHASSGSIVFGAGLRPDAVASEGTGAPPADLLMLRWLDLGALLLALGALAVNGRVLGSAGEGASRMRDRVRGMGVLATWVVVYAGLATPFLRTRSSGAVAPEWVTQTWLTLTRTEWGQLWLLRELALVVAAVAMVRWRGARGHSSSAPRVALGALVVAVLLQSWGGHAAALPTGSTLDALMGAGHVLAAGVWVGGLTVMAVTLVPRLHRAGFTGSRLALWRAYSPMAAVSCVVLMATGLYQAGHHVPDLNSLRTTVYGAAVGGKVVLVAVALALAAVNTLLVNPRIAARLAALTGHVLRATGPGTLARTVTAEVVVLSTAVLVAAVLTSVPTAREVAVATRASTPDVATVDGLFLTFESVPEGAGRSRLILRMRSTIQPEPAPVTSVDVRLDGPSGVSEQALLAAIEEGRYEGSITAIGPGDWRGTVSVHRAGLPDSVMISDWTVAPPAAALASPLRTVSTLVAAMMLAALGLVLVRTRRRRTPAGDSDPRHPILERSAT